MTESKSHADRTRTVVLGSGCFWCLDSLARRLRGVHRVRSVYTGGTGPAAYEAVSAGWTGHAEAVEITFDPEALPPEVLYEVFFSTHDPTSLNRQEGRRPQYRSVMFYTDEAERQEFEHAARSAQSSYTQPIVTSLEPLGTVYEAEPEHQDFYTRRPALGYCQFVIDPKIAHLRRRWPQWLAEETPA
ncbi:peptide-methionine (S)-S-oxide reductase MsrA [Nesterenkonia pannonica]|uniref:peptide-methionine (S)-S-oxide reductase MsrA n=1 Tax=Nesterenkonia pannonica TaxID=1548602 RepID=UPI002164868E|nr:peptide-methionine (S)-S-oxide reductase MsrA [Nesterenkonia pannonica]